MTRGLIRRLIRDGIINPAAVFGGAPTMPTRSLEALREAAILEATLGNVRHIPCASRLHAGWPDHEAHWHMRCPCGGVVAVCNERRERIEAEGGFHCNPITCRCAAFHSAGAITWTRI